MYCAVYHAQYSWGRLAQQNRSGVDGWGCCCWQELLIKTSWLIVITLWRYNYILPVRINPVHTHHTLAPKNHHHHRQLEGQFFLAKHADNPPTSLLQCNHASSADHCVQLKPQPPLVSAPSLHHAYHHWDSLSGNLPSPGSWKWIELCMPHNTAGICTCMLIAYGGDRRSIQKCRLRMPNICSMTFWADEWCRLNNSSFVFGL